MSRVLHQTHSGFECDEGKQKILQIFMHYVLPPGDEKLVFPMAYLGTREGL
jgi:hypothetical protein